MGLHSSLKGYGLSALLAVFNFIAISNAQSSYKPDNILNILHNGFRVRGGNELLVPNNISGISADIATFQDLLNTPEGEYFVGVLSFLVAMFIWLVIWIILLCTACCCKNCPCCHNVCILTAFVVCICVSALGWFFSIKGNTELDDGFNGLLSGVDDILAFARSALDDVNEIGVFASNLGASITNAGAECGALLGSGFPQNGLENVTDDVASVTGDAGDAIDNADQTIDDFVKLVEPFLDFVRPVYVGFTATVITLLFIFGITTGIRLLSTHDKFRFDQTCAAQTNAFINKFGVFIFFTVGLLLVILIWIIAAIISPIALIGADMCVPDLTTNLVKIASKFLTDDSDADICALSADNATENELAGLILCHYSTCEGDNPLFVQLGLDDPALIGGVDIFSEFVDAALELIDNVTDQIDFLNQSGQINTPQEIEDALDCIEATAAIGETFLQINDIFANIFDNLNCSSIQPLYSNVVDTQVCNGLISGLGIIWLTWTTACLSLMLAMYMYLLLKMRPGWGAESDDNVVTVHVSTAPEAAIVSEKEAKMAIATSGPIKTAKKKSLPAKSSPPKVEEPLPAKIKEVEKEDKDDKDEKEKTRKLTELSQESDYVP